MARSTHAYTAWIPGFVAGGLVALLLQRWQREGTKTCGDRAGAADTLVEFGEDGALPPLSEEQKAGLASTAQALATRGKGILAADESTPTVRNLLGVGCIVKETRSPIYMVFVATSRGRVATHAFFFVFGHTILRLVSSSES